VPTDRSHYLQRRPMPSQPHLPGPRRSLLLSSNIGSRNSHSFPTFLVTITEATIQTQVIHLRHLCILIRKAELPITTSRQTIFHLATMAITKVHLNLLHKCLLTVLTTSPLTPHPTATATGTHHQCNSNHLSNSHRPHLARLCGLEDPTK